MAEDDWKNVVIKTGVGSLLNYLAENQEASVSELSEELGVSEDRIKTWAEALDDNDFIDKTYSARKGMVLTYTKKHKENTDEKIEEVKEEIEEESKQVENELHSRKEEIKKGKKRLEKFEEELEENREEQQEIFDKMEDLEEMEEEIEETLEKEK